LDEMTPAAAYELGGAAGKMPAYPALGGAERHGLLLLAGPVLP